MFNSFTQKEAKITKMNALQSKTSAMPQHIKIQHIYPEEFL